MSRGCSCVAGAGGFVQIVATLGFDSVVIRPVSKDCESTGEFDCPPSLLKCCEWE